MSVSVCLCVFVCLQSYLQYYMSSQIATKFCVHVTYGRGSVLLW